MANYDNIKRYSEFAHEAAERGGVDEYLAEHAQSNYDLGVADEKETELWKILVAIVAGFAARELWGKYKSWLEKRKKNDIQKSQMAEQKIKKCVNADAMGDNDEHMQDEE